MSASFRFSSSAVFSTWVLCSAFALGGCPGDRPTPTPDSDAGLPEIAPEFYCPGSDGCADANGALFAGASAKKITPEGFEVARETYLEDRNHDKCEPGFPRADFTACGVLKSSMYDDCGNDAICIYHDDYVAPDDDGSEGDGVSDFFLDCGRDRLCPGDDGYSTPDADGSEGDGIFQGLWIAGYDNSRPAMGVKDDLWARTLVLRKGTSTVAMVTVDNVGYFYSEIEKIRLQLEATRPGEVDLVIVQSTHTHEAPDSLGQWGLEDPFTGLQLGHGRDDDFMANTRDQIVASILESLDGLQEATLKAGTVNTRVEGFLHDSRDPQIFNDILTAILVENPAGETIASVVNWGNHPETLDSRNNYISSDYVHAFRNSMQDGLLAKGTHPARAALGGVAIYQQGTVGGLMGPNHFPITGRDGTLYENRYRTWARTDAYGENLAEQAFTALENAVAVDVDLRFSTQTYLALIENQIFHVGFFNGWFDRDLLNFDPDAAIDEDNLPWFRTAVALVRLGPISWLTAPGELFPEVWVGYDVENSIGRDTIDPENPNPPDLSAAPTGLSLRDRTGGEFPILLGLGLDESGYMIPPYDFKLDAAAPWLEQADGDHYEETNSIGPQALPLYLENVGILLDFDATQ
ncbi:MAG: hypothetical protein GY822_05610 [Deltaproteobacteria bacterium]|nr:hypothetical protein [Deltaproteobacteria bacterium]